jgi:hypothetical protein
MTIRISDESGTGVSGSLTNSEKASGSSSRRSPGGSKSSRLGGLGGPAVEVLPALAAGVVDESLGEVGAGVVGVVPPLEEVPEEPGLDPFLILGRMPLAERDVADDLRAVSPPRPVAVRPGAHDEHVEDVGVLALDRLIDVQGAVQVFGVEPAADDHHRRREIAEVRQDAPTLPELVVVRVLDDLPPEEIVVAVVAVRVLQGAEVEVELVAVPGARVDDVEPAIGRRPVLLVAEDGGDQEIGQRVRALMMEVVEVEVGDRRLG